MNKFQKIGFCLLLVVGAQSFSLNEIPANLISYQYSPDEATNELLFMRYNPNSTTRNSRLSEPKTLTIVKLNETDQTHWGLEVYPFDLKCAPKFSGKMAYCVVMHSQSRSIFVRFHNLSSNVSWNISTSAIEKNDYLQISSVKWNGDILYVLYRTDYKLGLLAIDTQSRQETFNADLKILEGYRFDFEILNDNKVLIIYNTRNEMLKAILDLKDFSVSSTFLNARQASTGYRSLDIVKDRTGCVFLWYESTRTEKVLWSSQTNAISIIDSSYEISSTYVDSQNRLWILWTLQGKIELYKEHTAPTYQCKLEVFDHQLSSILIKTIKECRGNSHLFAYSNSIYMFGYNADEFFDHLRTDYLFLNVLDD